VKNRRGGKPVRGENLPAFMGRQLEFAAHIRNPALNPAPADVDPRRMRVYVELFFNNVESLLASAFPVAKSVLGPSRWSELVRRFLHLHAATTPYFLEISQEFLIFINGLRDESVPGFMIELCHYEWVELGLAVADEEIPEVGIDADGDLYAGVVVRSPLAWPLTYSYPVHRIGPAHQPAAPAAEPVQLVVYRRRDDSVRFMEINALTQRLLMLLDGTVSGAAALAALAAETPGLDAAQVRTMGLETLQRLRKAEIIAGTKAESGELPQ
jgi:hypothetical protein